MPDNRHRAPDLHHAPHYQELRGDDAYAPFQSSWSLAAAVAPAAVVRRRRRAPGARRCFSSSIRWRAKATTIRFSQLSAVGRDHERHLAGAVHDRSAVPHDLQRFRAGDAEARRQGHRRERADADDQQRSDDHPRSRQVPARRRTKHPGRRRALRVRRGRHGDGAGDRHA